MKNVNEMTSSELFTEMTEQQKDDIYRMVWFTHISEDVEAYLHDYYGYEEFTETGEEVEDIVESVANAWVYCEEYDCLINYFDNIENLIEKYREKK